MVVGVGFVFVCHVACDVMHLVVSSVWMYVMFVCSFPRQTMTGAVETTATSGASALGSSPCVRDAAEQSAAFAAIFSKFGACSLLLLLSS